MPTFPRAIYPASSDLAMPLSFISPLFNNPPAGRRQVFSPNFDLSEINNGEKGACYILEGELPGMTDKSAIGLEFIDGQTLVISGTIPRSTADDRQADGNDMALTRANEKPVRGSKLWLSERPSGAFRRSFTFPSAINLDAVTAVLENGLLRVVVPKLAPSIKRIEAR